MAFESFLDQNSAERRPRRWRRITVVGSLALHGVLIAGGVARSFWHVEELRPPSVTVTFLSALPPPPPPPPPPAAAPQAPAPTKPKLTKVVRRPELVQPTPQPVRAEPESVASAEPTAEPAGEAGGVPGGVTGGIAGAVLTAIVAAAPPPPPPPPVEEERPVMVPPTVGAGQRLTDVNDPQFRPSLPPALLHAGQAVSGLFRICVDAQGRVKDVKVLKSADALVDAQWSATLGRWTYRPYTVAGRPVSFCHAARIEVRPSAY